MLERAYRVHLRREENARYRRMMTQELAWAAELQNAVLGRPLPQHARVRFNVDYRPLPQLSCGGDYYEVIPAGKDRFLMLIGDVAGHGFRGALVTVIMKAVSDRIQLKQVFHDNPDPGMFLADWSDQIRLELGSQSDTMVTAGAALLDLGSSTVQWASAGHLPAHIVGTDSVRSINAPGPAFGVTGGAQYPTKKARLTEGERLCLFTDGLVETERGPLAKKALAEILIRSRDSTNYGQTVLTTALKATNRERFSDDVTLLSAELTG
jgi:sigma-B regulation protein RsbU (phosphoserine phosphatase)